MISKILQCNERNENMEGYLTDIQRFSLNDGAGIRTTLFFKGCNMKCVWCHNPETINFKQDLMLFKNKCIGCGKCFGACPLNLHKIEDGKHTVDISRCRRCGKCVDVCYAQALKFSAIKMTADQIEKEIAQDIPYYNLSGGGVTFSGGEALCQAEFVDELAQWCKQMGIHTAIETNMLHDFEKIEEVLKKMDLVMLDIKIFDDEKHKKYTGVSNRIILENVKKLDELNIPMIVRTPLIPKMTDDNENLKAICDFVSKLKNLQYYELLNFNPLGISKYNSMFEKQEIVNERPLPKTRLDEIKNMLSGCKVKIS